MRTSQLSPIMDWHCAFFGIFQRGEEPILGCKMDGSKRKNPLRHLSTPLFAVYFGFWRVHPSIHLLVVCCRRGKHLSLGGNVAPFAPFPTVHFPFLLLLPSKQPKRPFTSFPLSLTKSSQFSRRCNNSTSSSPPQSATNCTIHRRPKYFRLTIFSANVPNLNNISIAKIELFLAIVHSCPSFWPI